MENGSRECLLQLTHLPTRGELLSESLVSESLQNINNLVRSKDDR